jgi:hypothetical protein
MEDLRRESFYWGLSKIFDPRPGDLVELARNLVPPLGELYPVAHPGVYALVIRVSNVTYNDTKYCDLLLPDGHVSYYCGPTFFSDLIRRPR